MDEDEKEAEDLKDEAARPAAGRSGRPRLGRPDPTAPSDRDYLRFAHPVRDLPRLLPYLEKDSGHGGTGGAAIPVEDADAGIRRWRLRRRLLTFLLIAAVVFLMLSLTGYQAGFFIRHLPLLAFAALLVLAGTSPPVSPRTPWRRDPVRRGVAGVLTLAGTAAAFLAVSHLVPARASLATALYLSLGTVALLLVMRGWLSGRKAPQPAAAVPRAEPPARPQPAEDPSRPAVLQACREVVEQIAGNAPEGARATGWLDLSRSEEPGRKVWWRLRLPWEAGARLRLAGIDEVTEAGHTHRLLANLAVDPRRWRTEPGGSRHASFGLLTVEAFEVTPSRVSIRVLSPEREFRPYDLIELLKALEERVHPVAAAPEPGGGPA